MNLALIDLGSNSARMYLIDLKSDGSYSYINRYRVMTRLSEGMGKENILKELPVSRTIAVLKNFADIIKEYHAESVAVATAAVRKAINGDEFLRAVKGQTGIDLKVISGEKEANLDFKGVMSGLPYITDCLITDTGGGSTEIIYVKDREIQEKISFPFGAMSLTEKFGNDIQKAKEFIQAEFKKTDFLKEISGVPIVGIGGSLCAVYSIDLKLFPCENPTNIHGYTVTAARLSEILDRLCSMTSNERMDRAGVEKGRADTVHNGILPTVILGNLVSASSVILCTSGLREGIIAEINEKNTINIL